MTKVDPLSEISKSLEGLKKLSDQADEKLKKELGAWGHDPLKKFNYREFKKIVIPILISLGIKKENLRTKNQVMNYVFELLLPEAIQRVIDKNNGNDPLPRPPSVGTIDY